METLSDKTRAYLYAFAVHLAVFAMLFLGLFWATPEKPVVFAGAVIEAELIGKVGAPAHATAKPIPPKPAPTPEPPAPPDPPKPDPAPPKPTPTPPKPDEVKQPAPTVQHNDTKNQEKIDELALQKAEKAEKAQEAKHKQEQIELEEKQREEAEAKAQKQAEIQKLLDDIRKQRAAAAKQTQLAEQRMKQLDDLQKKQSQPPAEKTSKAPPVDAPFADVARTGANGDDASLLAEYQSAIQKVVTDNWNRPDTASAGVRCAVRIIQIPGGTVISANVVSPCNADSVTRTSITNAVTKAQPLPYKGYEKVFQREVTFIFKYDGN